jgi:DUF2911 family protein
MKSYLIKTVSAASFMACSAIAVQAQIKTPAPSPTQTVTQAFGLGEIKIEYSRPGVKGRVIFGELVPYGKVWRTGANQSTKITLSDTVKINNTAVVPGTYAIYTMPGQAEWDIMLYKDLTLGGDVADYKTANELMRFKAKPVAISDKMETFSIQINNVTSTSCSVDLVWDKTKVSIPVTTDIDTRIEKQIAKELAPGDRKPYYAAASYYYDNNKDLNKALEWANIAVENNPDAYWMSHLKAKIQLKMKDYAGAIKSAEMSMAKATADKNDDYVKLNEKLLAEAKKMPGK